MRWLEEAGPDALSAVLPARCTDKHGAEFVVRIYEPADRRAMEDFYDAFEPKRAAQGLPPKGAERVTRWLDGILGNGIHLVVEMNGELVGHAMLVPARQADVGEYAIFLRSDVRGHGVGTEVNRVTADVGRALGLMRLWLSVEPHNRAAIRSYEKTGYRFLHNTVFSVEAEMELVL